MSIKITENGNVHYVNEDDVNRDLFPNLGNDLKNEINSIKNAISTINSSISGLSDRVTEIDNQVLMLAVESEEKTISADAYINYDIPYTKPDGYNVIGAVVSKTPNAAHVTGFIESLTSTSILVGTHNSSTSPITGYYKLIVFCRKV